MHNILQYCKIDNKSINLSLLIGRVIETFLGDLLKLSNICNKTRS